MFLNANIDLISASTFKAITNNEFVLYFQPKYDVQHNRLHGFEALVRWPQDDGSLIYPDEFIPLAEQNCAIIPLTQLLMKQLQKLVYPTMDIIIGLPAMRVLHGRV